MLVMLSGVSWGQVSITSTGTAFTENFDGMGTSGTATLPSGFKIGTDWSSGTTATTLAYGTTGTGAVTGTSSGGTINWANGITGSATDRSLGFLTSGSFSSPRSVIYAFTNNTGATITSLTIAFDYEKSRSGSRAFGWTFFHGNTSTATVAATGGDQAYVADANNTTIYNPPTTTIKSFTVSGLSIAEGTTYYLRWTYTGSGGSTNSQGLSIDNFSITATAGAIAGTSTITTGAGTEPATLSSLVNTSGASSVNFDFTVTDDGATADTDPTLINQIVINQGSNNSTVLSNWTQAIAGAELSDGTNTLSGTVNAANITFASLANTLTTDIGYVADNGTKTYTLKIWLNSTLGGTLPTNIDGKQFEFLVQTSGVSTNGTGSSVIAASQSVSSGASTNVVTVVATQLAFVQNTTSPTGISTAMAPAPTVSANDINSNRDLDFTGFIEITSTGTLLGTPVSTQAVAGLSTFSGAIIHTVAGTGFQLTAAFTGLTSATSNLFDIQTASSASDYFRSVGSGNWGTATTWESSADNTTWIPATLAPTSAANTITIRNGHTVTVAAAVSADQVTVEAGGIVNLNGDFTLANAPDAYDLLVNGTVINTNGSHTITGAIQFNAASLYQHNRNGGSLPMATWDVASTAEITGIVGSTSLSGGVNQTFGNFIWNSVNQTSTLNLVGVLSAVTGDFRVQNSGSGQLRLTGSADLNLNVGGNFIIEDDIDIDNNATGVCNISIGGNYVQTGGTIQSSTDIATITMTGSGKTFTQSGGTLTGANINWVVNSGADLTLLNNLTIAASRSLTVAGTVMTNSGTANINGTFQLNDGGWGGGTTGFVYGASATLVFNTTGNYGVNNDAYWPATNGPVNVTVQNTGGITMNVARTVTGLCQTSAGIANANNLTFDGTFQLNAGGYVSGAGRPVYGPASLLKYNTGGTYGRGNEWYCSGGAGCPNDLQISNNTVLNVPNGTSFVNGQIQGNLTIDAGSAMYMDYGGAGQNNVVEVYKDVVLNGSLSLGDAVGGDLHVRGNWTKAVAATFTPNGRAVFFNGPSGDQTITGTTTFDYLVLNKAAGNLLLASPISLNQTLTLTNGKVVLGANDLSVLNAAPSSLSAGSATSYVVTDGAGALRRSIGTVYNGDYFFPVGNTSNRQLATVNFGSISANNTLAARFITGASGTAGLPLTEGENIARTANDGYWEVNAASATSDTYTGTFVANGFTDITDYTKVHLLKRAGAVSAWTLNGTHVTTTGSNALASLQRTGMSGFSQFAVGGESLISLPSVMLSFSGYKSGSINKLSWTTVSEQNNRGFAVERSADGVNYTAIGFVNSLAVNGNSDASLTYSFTDANPTGSKQYYRLRQQDINGVSRLSNVIVIKGEKATALAIDGLYPNPVSSQLNVAVSSPVRGTVTLQVVDMTGRILSQQVKAIAEGSNTVSVNVASLSNGSYILKVVNAETSAVSAKFSKQ